MSFEELIEEVRQIKSDHRKIHEKDFFEAVITWKELAPLTQILKKHFGSPFKAADEWPSEEMRKITAPFGGIRTNQTLYYLTKANDFNLAMLWLWGDGMLITVKLIRGIPDKQDEAPQNFWKKIKGLFQ